MRKAIAIDFDGCLCTDDFPAIGEPNWAVINRAKTEQRAGAGLILWTCREGSLLLDAVAACAGWGLTFDAINESLPDWIEKFRTRPRKVGASEYWDDKAARIPTTLRFFVGGPGDDSIELITPTPGNENMALKPCPFCESTNVVYERYGVPTGERWRCWCAECLAGIDPGTAQEMGTVRDMWNRRARRPNSPLTLEELKGIRREPVFIEYLKVDLPGEWKIIRFVSDREVGFTDGTSLYLPNSSPGAPCYGRAWLAYRRKTEEGT